MATQPKKPILGRPSGSSGEETRSSLLQAAAKQFSEREFAEVSMSQIAKAAGLTSAAIYNHYKSKDDLFQETVKAIISRNIELLSDAAAIKGNWKTKLSNVLDATLITQRNDLWSPLITSTAQLKMAREPEKFAEILELRKAYSAIFQQIIETAITQGDLEPDTPVAIMGDLLMALTANGIGAVMVHRTSEDEISQTIRCFKALINIGH
ncbi:TetR/AcrR family transcriptional regulator [Parasphingorhabdus cellanae]|uniref:TetR/AcrR family transcriptional regulator n=1 Tax=Parasphingorhabdus cellanae TaxID=2806553 RepID=A0ABX7T6X1_9SPHN|nr:TetR/AcrR family transcriptional regulator [Parasphingorhabdus cellanae]QTD56876.1 TetR/AcrR family transcriptional regulator [Parasphingorhabdus cellanae]